MDLKKKQYEVLMCTLNQIQDIEGKLYLNWNEENFTATSESHLIRQIQKIRNEVDEKITQVGDCERVNLISIKSGKITKYEKEILNKMLKEGFYVGDIHYSLIKLLGGSHHKQVKQFYTTDVILEKLQPRIDMKELSHTTRAKRLTSNALLTTDIYAVPYNLKDLDICIIPDNELILELSNMNGIVSYEYKDMMEEEQRKYNKKTELDEEIKEMFKAYNKMVDDENFDYSKFKLAEGFSTYKTPSRWLKEDNRLVMIEEVSAPQYYTKNKKGKKFIAYTENQTIPIDEELLEIAEWSTGYKLIDVESIAVNNFDGMALASWEFGQVLQGYLQSDLKKEEKHLITGYQLRLPQIKGFFPMVNIRTYFKEKGIAVIYDIFGEPHDTSKIDILGCESIFKAKLDTSSGKKQWMWNNIDEYKEALVENKYDCIGVANYSHELKNNEYRNITYQLLSSMLKLSQYELLALATPQGKMIASALNIYRKEEIEWEDIKYIQVYLNNILENKESNDDDYVETAIEMLNLNKYMVFDKKFTSFLFNHIKQELEQMCLGRIKLHSNYTYVTGDVLGFLKYASKFSDEKCKDKEYRDKVAVEKVEGYLKENEFYMAGTTSEKILVRNPLMKESEVEHAIFVDIEDEDVMYIRQLKNIIQSPMNTSIFQKMGGYDEDGDELHLIHLDYNLKSANVDWLINFNFENRIETLKKDIQEYFDSKYKGKEVITFADLIRDDLKVQVNINDKVGEEGSEWTIENIADFILSSNDKTGTITDINTTILNYLNRLYRKVRVGDITKEEASKYIKQLVLSNQIMKHKQGEMIDASKTGVEVDIPKIIKKTFDKRPYFYKYKGKLSEDLTNTDSALERFCKKIEGLINSIEVALDDRIRDKIKEFKISNLSSYIFNNEIAYTQYEEYIEPLKKLKKEYGKKKNELIREKKKINMYSKNDEDKESRKQYRKKWSNLIKETRDKAKEICPANGVRGNAVIAITYEISDGYDFAWVVASDVFLTRLENNQTESYLVTRAVDGEIEYLGKKYKCDVKKVKNKCKSEIQMDKTKLEDYELSVCAYKSDADIKRETLNKLKEKEVTELKLVEEDGFIKINIDGINLGINQKCYAKGNLKQRVGQTVMLKDILKASPNSVKILVDVN